MPPTEPAGEGRDSPLSAGGGSGAAHPAPGGRGPLGCALAFWRKEAVVIGTISCLVGAGVGILGIKVAQSGVKVSEGARMDALGARLDALGARLDAANQRNSELVTQLGKVREHEKRMWDLANEICRHLVEEEEKRAQGASPGAKGGPPKYIAGVPLRGASGVDAQHLQAQLCSLMPPDPGIP